MMLQLTYKPFYSEVLAHCPAGFAQFKSNDLNHLFKSI